MKRLLNLDRLKQNFKTHTFSWISWGVTLLLVAALIGTGLWWTGSGVANAATRPIPTVSSDQSQPTVVMPTSVQGPNSGASSTINRQLELKTKIPGDRPPTATTAYVVVSGDSMFAIAKQFSIKPETILYSNKDTLKDNPENLKPGMTLTIPPVDGVLYQWQTKDTVQTVALQFKARPDDILNWLGNNIDLTNPQIQPGTLVMIPGGQRKLIDWTQFIPTIARGSGTGTSNVGTHACGGGPVGSGFIWPTHGPHTISGNNFGPTHLGLDITANQGDPVIAASAGVVVMAQGGDNYGYGNVVQIDHGNGYSTVYAHLSQINVAVCAAVSAGQVIGLAGSTGNSTGAHLHFEIRKGGTNLNPWDLLQ
jgi:murein DD-endopeptidase MepM/ murein hydrolase activator NlpD